MKLFPLFLLLFFFTGCEKGAFGGTNYGDKFSCKINGEKWTPKGDGGGSVVFGSDSPIQARYSEIGKSISINAVHKDSDRFETVIVVSQIDKTTGAFPYRAGEFSSLLGFQCNGYEFDSTMFNEVNILSFNEDDQKISGTFQFATISTGTCADTILITDGRFDLNFS